MKLIFPNTRQVFGARIGLKKEKKYIIFHIEIQGLPYSLFLGLL
jgi:hypothetical protein